MAARSNLGRRHVGYLLILLALPIMSSAGTLPAAVVGIAVGITGCVLAEFV